MTNPCISVIVPVYNAANTLVPTIRSVLAQTHSNFELIAIDDGSTDYSLKILLEFADSDSRIRVVSQPNMGVAATRNNGMSMAKGALIAFLDADDIWHPEKLSRHSLFHAPGCNVDISYARIAFVGPNRTQSLLPKTTSSILPRALTVADLLAENPVCTMSNLVVRKRIIDQLGNFRVGMSFAEDQEWLARAANIGFSIKGIDEVLVDYRLSPDGLSANLNRMYEGWRTIAHQYSDQSDLVPAEAVYCRYLCRRALRTGASSSTAWHFAKRGLHLERSAFLADTRRGWMTVFCALLSHALPRRARLFLFA